MMARMDGRNVVISRVCAVIALAVVMHMLPIVPAHAGGGWLSESIAVRMGNAARKTVSEDGKGLLEAITAGVAGNEKTLSRVFARFDKFEGTVSKNVFYELDLYDLVEGARSAVGKRLDVANKKIHRFAGRFQEGVADVRAALAVDRDDRAGERPSGPGAASGAGCCNICRPGSEWGAAHNGRGCSAGYSCCAKRACCAPRTRRTDCGDGRSRDCRHAARVAGFSIGLVAV